MIAQGSSSRRRGLPLVRFMLASHSVLVVAETQRLYKAGPPVLAHIF
jgi:hypothetical protein